MACGVSGKRPAFALTPAIRLQDDYSDAASDAVLRRTSVTAMQWGKKRVQSIESSGTTSAQRSRSARALKQEEHDKHDEQEGQDEECEVL